MSDAIAETPAAPIAPAEPAPAAAALAEAAAAPPLSPVPAAVDDAVAHAKADAYSKTQQATVDPTSPPPEAAIPAAKPEAPKTVLKSSAFRERVEAARKEQLLRRREAEIVAREQELSRQLEQLTQAKALAKKDPKALLSALGLEYDDVVSAQLNADAAVDPVSEARKAAEEVAARSLGAFREEQQRRDAERAWQAFSREVVKEVRGLDQFELVNSKPGAAERIPLLSAQTYRETGVQPSVSEVAEYLEGELEKEMQSFLATKKARASLVPPPVVPGAAPGASSAKSASVPVVASSAPAQKAPEVPSTLSNGLTPAPGSVSTKKLSMEDLKANAVIALRKSLGIDQ